MQNIFIRPQAINYRIRTYKWDPSRIYLAVNRLTTNKTHKNETSYLITKHVGFIRVSQNKVDQVILINGMILVKSGMNVSNIP